MIAAFIKYIDHEGLLTQNGKTLLAVSGGIDSVVMSHLFAQTPFEFGIAHCNFQLRGEESDGDEAFVEALANDLGVAYFCKRFDTKNYAETHGISTQMAARELRYTWFDGIVEQHDYAQIATAHHLNDSIETFLFNFSKGTGISGLRGILPKNKNTVRPLLFATRQMIEGYVTKQKLTWRDDSSNEHDTYSRNKLRHNVIPELKAINPSLENTAITTFERLKDVDAIFKNQVIDFQRYRINKTNSAIYLSLHDIDEVTGAKALLHEALKVYGFNYFQTKLIWEKRHEAGKLFYAPDFELCVDRGQLVITPIDQQVFEKAIEINTGTSEISTPFGMLKFTWDSIKPDRFPEDENVAYLDTNKLKFPLKLRKWKNGDTFIPLGMKHKKKLSDLMIDRKIPLNLKERVLVLESGEDIVWVVNQQLDDRFKLTPSTTQICQIEFVVTHA